MVVVEGDEEGVGQYVRKLHGLRWQQMVSRHINQMYPMAYITCTIDSESKINLYVYRRSISMSLVSLQRIL